MNYKCKIAICLLLGAANFALLADDVASPPVITANGIMAAGETEQVIFKVTDKKTAQDQSYILSAGDEQAGIKVLAIDASSDIVTFDNHGTVQKIALAKPVFTANTASTPTQVTQSPTPTVNPPIPAPRISKSAARGGSVVVIGNRANYPGRKSINGITAQTANGGGVNNFGANNFNQNRSQTPGNANSSSPVQQSSPSQPTASTPVVAGGPRQMSIGADDSRPSGAGASMAQSLPR